MIINRIIYEFSNKNVWKRNVRVLKDDCIFRISTARQLNKLNAPDFCIRNSGIKQVYFNTILKKQTFVKK